jgi:outer membrane protein OmpA-like peptidoglycan-associated protein
MLPTTSDAAETADKNWRVGAGVGAFKMTASYPGDSETYSKVLPGYLVNLGYMAAPWLETGVLITGGGKGDDTQGLNTIALELPALPQVYAKMRQDIDEDMGFYEVLTLGSLKQEATDSAGNSVFSDSVTIIGLGAGVSWYANEDWTMDVGIFSPSLIQASSGSGLDTNEIGLTVAFNYAFGFGSDEATPREVKEVVAAPVVAPQPVEPVVVVSEPVALEIIDLEGVYFASGGSDLDASSAAVLDQAVDTLLRRTDINVEVAAHSDNVGRDKFNLLLSEKRAHSVRAYLVNHGYRHRMGLRPISLLVR